MSLLDAHRIKNMLGLYGVQIINLLLPLLSLPYLLRALGTEGFGHVAHATAAAMVFVMLIDAGFAPSALRLISKNPLSRNAQRTMVAAQQIRVALALLILLGMLITFFMFNAISFQEEVFWHLGFEQQMVLLGLINLAGTIALPTFWFVANERGMNLAWLHLSGRLLSLICLVLFVSTPNDAMRAMAITSSATLVSGVIAHAWLISIGRLPWREYLRWNRRAWRVLIGSTRHLFWSQATQALIVNLPVLLIGWLHGKSEAGIYASVEKVARLSVALLEPLNATLSPHLTRLSSQQSERAQQLAGSMFAVSFGIACVGFGVYIFADHYILSVLFGARHSVPVELLHLFGGWACLHILFRQIESTQLIALGRLDIHQRVIGLVIPGQAVALVFGSLGGAVSAITCLLVHEILSLIWLAISIRSPLSRVRA